MKRIIFISLFFCVSYVAGSQVKPEAIFGIMPPIPNNVCNATPDVKNKFRTEVDSISQLVRDDLDRIKNENEANAESKEPEMMANMMKQSGMSEEDILQMPARQKSKKSGGNEQKEMSEKETDAMVDKMLQQNYNISMDEVKNLDKMDENAKKGWATALATEKKAEVMADPEKFEKERIKNMKSYELVTEYKRLTDSLNAQQEKFGKMFNKLEEDTSGLVMLRNISKWKMELSGLGGIDYGQGPQMEALAAKIKSEKQRYCALFSPKYIDILQKYLRFTKNSIKPYYRLELLQNQVTASQTGVDFDMESGYLVLPQVQSYLQKLAGAYKYNLLSEFE